MSLKLNSSGGGSVTLQEPVTASTLTLNLPAFSGTVANLAAVTNNGVLYVNSSGQPTSGSALTFDGTKFTQTASTTAAAGLAEFKNSASNSQTGNITAVNDAGTSLRVMVFGSAAGSYGMLSAGSAGLYTGATELNFVADNASGVIKWGLNGAAEQMRLTSTGLGIGTSSPDAKLKVSGDFGATFALLSDNTGVGYGKTITTASGVTESVRLSLSSNVSGGSNILLQGNAGGGGNGANGTVFFGDSGYAFAFVRGARTSGAGSTSGGVVVFATTPNNSTTAVTERARITSGGEFYIAGTTDQGAYNLQVNGTGVWGAGAYVNGSDARLKDDVQDLASALNVVIALRPVTFKYKADYSKDQSVQPGFIAQELQQVLGEQVYVDGVVQAGPEHLNVAYQNLIPILTKAIQELKAEFDAYKATHP